MRRLTLLVVALMMVASPALAHPGTSTIPLPTDFGPEGIAAGRGNTFYVGSLVDGDIIVGDLSRGDTRLLVDAPEGRMAVGLSYDRRHDLLFVAGGGTGNGYIYDASSGEEVALITLVDPSAGTFINDVVVTRHAVWFTDSANAQLYKVPIGQRGALQPPETLPLTGDAAQLPGAFNLNGIDATPDGGALVVAHSALGALFTVDPTTGASAPIDLGGAALTNVDGILLDGRTLWAVQNQLNQVVRIRLSGDLSSGRVVDTITDPNFQVPTTVARFGGRLALPNAKFNLGFPGPGRGIPYEVVVVPIS